MFRGPPFPNDEDRDAATSAICCSRHQTTGGQVSTLPLTTSEGSNKLAVGIISNLRCHQLHERCDVVKQNCDVSRLQIAMWKIKFGMACENCDTVLFHSIRCHASHPLFFYCGNNFFSICRISFGF
jgi:hypothetical protein